MTTDLPVCHPVYVIDDNAARGVEIGRRLRAVGMSNQICLPVQHFLDAAHLLPPGTLVLDALFLSGVPAPTRQRLDAAGMPIISLSSPLPDASDEQPGGVSSGLAVNVSLSGARERINMLSRREREVLGHLVTGKSTKAIAAGLGLSPRTVETHRSRLLKHLKVASTAHAIRIAVEAGL